MLPQDLNITSSVPSALHREDITLNPPRFWPLPCCTEGELVHHNASSMELTWRLPKADWVYGSTGNVLPETGFWMFDNVGAHVVTSPTESCFEVGGAPGSAHALPSSAFGASTDDGAHTAMAPLAPSFARPCQ